MFDMLGNVVKNLFSKPATRMYPVNRREPFKGARGCVGINIESCVFCGLCSRKCPSGAIKVDRNEKAWELDPFKCIICGVCAEACPKKSIYMNPAYNAPAYSKHNVKFVRQLIEDDINDKIAQNK